MLNVVRFLPSVGEHPLDLFHFAAERLSVGERCALAMVTDVDGSFPRSPGAFMIISETGNYAGSLSNGCVDLDIVQQAIKAIHSRTFNKIRYGKGSPFFDIKLPCGGGIEVLIVPYISDYFVDTVVTSLKARTPITIAIHTGTETISVLSSAESENCWMGDVFHMSISPKLRVVAAGRGSELIQLMRVTLAAQYEAYCYSPDKELLEECSKLACGVKHLSSSVTVPNLPTDRWTAIVLLFHEHEWEQIIFRKALASEAFYVGALGSRATHKGRIDKLVSEGYPPSTLKRIKGPIGLVPSTRDSSALAISVLAQILDVFISTEKTDAPQ